jgi:hypothetical protein
VNLQLHIFHNLRPFRCTPCTLVLKFFVGWRFIIITYEKHETNGQSIKNEHHDMQIHLIKKYKELIQEEK